MYAEKQKIPRNEDIWYSHKSFIKMHRKSLEKVAHEWHKIQGKTKKIHKRSCKSLIFLVELRGVEPLTSWMRTKRSPNWATAPSVFSKNNTLRCLSRIIWRKLITLYQYLLVRPTGEASAMLRMLRHVAPVDESLRQSVLQLASGCFA